MDTESLGRELAVLFDDGAPAVTLEELHRRSEATLRTPAQRRPALIAVVAFLAVLAVGLGTWWMSSDRDPTADTSPPTTVGEVTPTTVTPTTAPPQTDTDRVIELPADRYPKQAALAGDRFWVIADSSPPESGQPPATDSFLMGVDAATGAVEVEVSLTDAPNRVAATEEAVWVTHWETGSVSRLDPETGEVVATIPLELPFDFGGNQDNFLFIPFDIVIGHGSVWVSTGRGAVAQIDQDSNELIEIHEFPNQYLGGNLAVGPGGVWVTGDLAGVYHLSSASGEITNIPLETLDHSAGGVFVPGDDSGDTVYVWGDRLERSEEGEFRVIDGGYTKSGESAVTAIDQQTREILGSTEFDHQIVHLGWVNGFIGALDETGVFTHLSEIPRLGSQVNETTWNGGLLFKTSREAWEIDTDDHRLVRVDETGVAAVELPFEIDEGTGGRRPIPDELAVSEDWEVRESAPIQHRWPAVIAWTGEEIVIWGGESLGGFSAASGGAAYDVGAGTWREMSDSPLSGPRNAGWVWTGGELVIWTSPGDAAAWQPEANTWRVIDDWPLGASSDRRAVWTGAEILSTTGLAVDPSTGDSAPIAEPPEFHERSSVVWADGHMVSLTSDGSYNLAADEWIDMPESNLTPLSVSGVPLNGSVVAADYEMRAARYDPSANTWTELPDVPLRFYECGPNVQAFRDGAVVEHCAGTAIWDPADATWTPITHPDPAPQFAPSIIAAGARLFAWGDQFYEFVGDPDQPSRLAVGTSILDVPDGWAVSSVTGGNFVNVSIEASGGEECAIVAAHVGAEGFLQSYMTDTTTATQITPDVGGDTVDALAVPEGAIDDRYHLVWPTGSTDAIDLACTTQTAADEIAPRIWHAYQ